MLHFVIKTAVVRGVVQKSGYFTVRLTIRGGMHVKIARDKSARRTSSYAGSFLIQ